MRVTIVTISYNQVAFLEAALRSVLTQSYSDIEYVVVDPGSTDGSREIIERFASQITKIVYEKDSGPADGLNKGFAYATGDVYGFLNADDVLLPDAVAEAVAFLTCHGEVDVVSGNALIVDALGRPIRMAHSDAFDLRAAAYGAAILIQPSSFFRRQFFQRVGGFNTANRSNWDGELFIDLAKAGAKFGRVGRTWSHYRLHDASITGTKQLDEQLREYRRRMFQKIMRRDFTQVDHVIQMMLWLRKHLLNPQGTLQRIRFGPIYGRAVKHPQRSVDGR